MARKWKCLLILLLLAMSFCANADLPDKSHDATDEGLPWFTGPLLASAGEVIPNGHTDIEPYFYATRNYGFYNNSWGLQHQSTETNLNPLLDITRGIANRVDVETLIPYFFNSRSGQSANGWGDMVLILGYQAISSKKWPNLRVTLSETFPTGKYKNLNPFKFGIDGVGGGVYQTQLSANFEKLLEINSSRYIDINLNIDYTFPASRKVVGFNVYGGGIGTNGTVHVGSRFSTDLAFEYTLTKHWVPALDIVYVSGAPITFSGTSGITLIGTMASVGQATQQEVSLAPAIEYNFNSHVGIISGIWFSVAGRNAPAFNSWVTAINIFE